MNRFLVLNLDEESYAECERTAYIEHCHLISVKIPNYYTE
jgi:hypothetical protein